MIIKKIKKQPSEKTNIIANEVNKDSEEKIDLFDLDNIDFSERQERRRGDRRRGYRRIDDRNLISRAHEEVSTIKETARKEGYSEGLKEAQEDIGQVKIALAEFMNAGEEVFEYIAPDILEISVDIAKKIVKKEIEQNPQLILNSILDVLKTLSKDEKKVSVKVNPEQLETAKQNIPQMAQDSGLEFGIKVYADDTIEVGGCVLNTHNGIVDATIDTQLEIVKEILKGI